MSLACPSWKASVHSAGEQPGYIFCPFSHECHVICCHVETLQRFLVEACRLHGNSWHRIMVWCWVGVIFDRSGTHSFSALMRCIPKAPGMVKDYLDRVFHLGNSVKVFHNICHARLKDHLLAKNPGLMSRSKPSNPVSPSRIITVEVCVLCEMVPSGPVVGLFFLVTCWTFVVQSSTNCTMFPRVETAPGIDTAGGFWPFRSTPNESKSSPRFLRNVKVPANGVAIRTEPVAVSIQHFIFSLDLPEAV